MLSLIRRLIHSKVGLFVTFGLLALIALAFAGADITGLNSANKPLTGDAVATIGKAKITATDLRGRAQDDLENYRQQQPTLDMAQYVAGGGLDATLDRTIAAIALEQFGLSQGMVVSKKAVDGQIASIPALQGADGKFSQQVYQQLLAQRKLTDQQVRDDIARQTVARQLVLPMGNASQVPMQLALPYASLLLEKRQGQVAFIPTAALGNGAPPTDAEVAGWYKRNIVRYTVPERRTIRYAMVTLDQIRAQTVPSDVEIATAYQSQRASFTPSEKRTLAQVILPDQAAATALVAKVKAGMPIAAAARAVGLEAVTLTAVDKTAYSAQSSAAIADAAFAAAQGGLVGPVRGALGFTVVRVDAIQQVPGKSLEQARPELVAAVTKTKTAEVLGRIHDAIDDSIADRATFAEIVSDQKLTAKATPALLPDGRNPDDASVKAAADFLPVVTAAFAAEPGDSPQLVPVDKDGGFALVALDRVVAPVAPPVAQIRPAVARDFAIDRARRAARAIAADVVAKANKGGALPQLLTTTGLKVPPIQSLNASRAQLSANPRGAPPPLTLLFSMSERTTKLLEAPNDAGWLVIHLDRIERGNAAGNAAVVAAMRADLGKVAGREYVDQFTEAVRRAVGVKKDKANLASVKASLSGQGGAAN